MNFDPSTYIAEQECFQTYTSQREKLYKRLPWVKIN